MRYARFSQADIFWHESPGVVVGSPQFVTGYLIGSMARRAYKNQQARRLSQPRWWPTELLRVVVTSRRLWCQIGESGGVRWLNFNYDTVTRLDLTTDGLILSFLASDPLRLSGSWAPWCAAVIAHLRFGRDAAAVVPALHRAAFAR
ncbi:hypothetical protein [Amycolatopsis sp. SID8362]|uniref:hypothetical protein n=1 Tax=Amycolatopsis sp. SID8362 TaxID=2690346 RepID=UPI0013680452|nr:hypothetical protein [Amycolatopsis sp. SID8362]NBH10963.1 hypothetical protein [Amycolatopsis sp. SID8362]NED47654.1 hypothetical protein [Amycolatopsis sp. SID8362]